MIRRETYSRLLEFFRSRSIIDGQKLQALAEIADAKLHDFETLFFKAGISEQQLCEAFSSVYSIPVANIACLVPQDRALSLMSRNVAERLNVLPVSLSGAELTLVLSNPADENAMNELNMLGRRLKLLLAPKTELARIAKYHYRFAGLIAQDKLKEPLKRKTEFEHSESPVEEFINDILETSAKDGASDIHFEPLANAARIRYRIDGSLFSLMTFQLGVYAQIVSRLKIMADMDIAERRHPRDGRIMYMQGENRFDVRVSTLPTIHGEKVVLRLLKQDETMFELGKLGFDKAETEFLQSAVNCENGLILIAGPTGSGKSTTLHALMRLLNNETSNIISIEDPVEYTIAGVNQVQVNDKIELHFSNILRSVLRQDPDKIMIGEIRDLETAKLAIRAALTGHLVLTTVHADNAAGAITRLVDMGIQPFLLASALKYVVSQRLVGKLCPNCRTAVTLSAKQAALLGISDEVKVYRSNGCEQCRHSGTKGRTVIAELAKIDDRIKELFARTDSEQKIAQHLKEAGIKSLNDALAEKILKGEVSVDEIFLPAAEN